MKLEELPQDYMFDYRAGYVRSGTTIPGFDVYGGDGASQSIVTLGGFEGWAKQLYEQRPDLCVYDGCTGGHTTAQAMIMMIRDGLLLKPDIIVCVSGYYNFAYQLGIGVSESDAEILRAHPFATPNHIRYYTAIAERRMGLGNQKIYYGEKITAPAWETWAEHLKIMNALCEEFGIKFAAFLEPNPVSGNIKLAEYYTEAARAAAREPYIYLIPVGCDGAEQIAAEVKKTLWND